MRFFKITLTLATLFFSCGSYAFSDKSSCIENVEQINKRVEKYGELTGWFSHVEKTIRFDIPDYQVKGTIQETYISLIYTDWLVTGGSGTTKASLVVSYPRVDSCSNYYKNKSDALALDYLKKSIFIIPQISSRKSSMNIPKVVTDIAVENNNLVIYTKRHDEEDASNFPSTEVKYHVTIVNDIWKLKEI